MDLEQLANNLASKEMQGTSAERLVGLSPKRRLELLRNACQGKVLFDLGAGKNAVIMAQFADEKLGSAQYVAVDKHYNPDLSQYNNQAPKFIHKKQDALLFLRDQEDNAANITINGIDDEIIDPTVSINEKYIRELLQLIARKTAPKGLVFGLNTPFLKGLKDLGFKFEEEIPDTWYVARKVSG